LNTLSIAFKQVRDEGGVTIASGMEDAFVGVESGDFNKAMEMVPKDCSDAVFGR